MPKKAFYSISESKREKILSCALTEFSGKEYHNSSINHIIKCAEIPRGSFYQYFENKDDLYFHLLENILEKELEDFFKNCIDELPTDPFHSHQMMFAFNLHMLDNNLYRGFFRNFFLAMSYRFSTRYKEVVNRQRDKVLTNLGLDGSQTGEQIKETLEVFSLITIDLLARKVMEELSDDEIWSKYRSKLKILGLDS